MLRFVVTNARERQHLEHSAGVIEFGRGPQRNHIPRCTIPDPYVSKDHVRLEELAGGRIRVENLSQKQPIVLGPGFEIAPGGVRELPTPARLAIGDTTIDVEPVFTDTIPSDQLLSIRQAPIRDRHAAESQKNLLQLGGSPSPETLAHWFETVIAVQRAAAGSPEFYQQTAEALVSRVGLDRGLVLLRQGDAWKVVARACRDEGPPGREFSHTILRQVVSEKRTFYQSAAIKGSSSESLVGVQSLVASPVFDARDEVVGAVYGSRMVHLKTRDVGPLEAQVVQLLASAVGAGLARLEQDAEANRLRVAKQAAEEADRAKGQFLATFSHELRTPLTTIIGYSEMLIEQAQSEGLEDFTNDLNCIHASARHLLNLINDILDLSKIEAGKMELAKETFDLAQLVQDAATSVRPQAQKNGNALEIECAPGLGMTVGDPIRLKQCLLNLLSNACKFTERGVVHLRAWRQRDGDGDWLSFQVRDSGIGIPPDKMGTIFERFGQVESTAASKYGGTGLGLPITRKLCHMMGGDITADSTPGKGSVFTIRIPARN